jgi:hypothetical protein
MSQESGIAKNFINFVPNGLSGDLKDRGTYAELKKSANDQKS